MRTRAAFGTTALPLQNRVFPLPGVLRLIFGDSFFFSEVTTRHRTVQVQLPVRVIMTRVHSCHTGQGCAQLWELAACRGSHERIQGRAHCCPWCCRYLLFRQPSLVRTTSVDVTEPAHENQDDGERADPRCNWPIATAIGAFQHVSVWSDIQ